MTPIVKVVPIFANDLEKIVYTAIDNRIDTVDELLRETQLEMTDLLTTIAMLEIA
jgi:hypothetical protein